MADGEYSAFYVPDFAILVAYLFFLYFNLKDEMVLNKYTALVTIEVVYSVFASLIQLFLIVNACRQNRQLLVINRIIAIVTLLCYSILSFRCGFVTLQSMIAFFIIETLHCYKLFSALEIGNNFEIHAPPA